MANQRWRKTVYRKTLRFLAGDNPTPVADHTQETTMQQNPFATTAGPIYPEAWNAGVEAGLLKDRRHPPAGMDRYSFYAGLMEGKSMRAHASQQTEVSELARQLTHWTPRQKKILRRLCIKRHPQE